MPAASKAPLCCSTPVVDTSSPLKPPNSKTPEGRHQIERVVEAAIKLSTQIGNSGLGLAIEKLHHESLSNDLLADLLNAILAQRAMPAQMLEFQTYVKNALAVPVLNF